MDGRKASGCVQKGGAVMTNYNKGKKNRTYMKLLNALINRLSWFCTLLVLSVISLIAPEVIEYALKQYREDQIKNFWMK
jgi:hypothetical protein